MGGTMDVDDVIDILIQVEADLLALKDNIPDKAKDNFDQCLCNLWQVKAILDEPD
jgi:hypothetical protein